MSAQPAKRRKRSPLTATPVLNRHAESASASRASFMSPTRASLARFNPSLLPQPRSASAGIAGQDAATPTGAVAIAQTITPDQFLVRGQEAFNYIMGNFNAQMQRTLAAVGGHASSPLVMNQPILATPTALPAGNGLLDVPTGEETEEQMEAMRSVIRARKQQERAESMRAASIARSTPMSTRRRFQSMPLQALIQGDDDELSMEIGRNDIEGVRAGSVRTSLEPRSAAKVPRRKKSLPQVVDEEMDELSPDVPRSNPRTQRLATEDEGLPDTPELVRRQMEAEDHPPRGVLFSSPSKRRRTQTTPKKSQQKPVQRTHHQEFDLPQNHDQPQEPEILPDVAQQANIVPVIKPASTAQPDAKQLVKQEEKARLEIELQKLREEVKHFERYAQLYTSRQADAPEDIRPLIDLMNVSGAMNQSQQPETALSSLLTSFLPFSIPVASPLAPAGSPEQREHFVSHEPLKEKDPLPLSSLFTPLGIASSISVPTQIADSNRLSQKHSITLSSPGSLLVCSMDLTVSSEPSAKSVPAIENLEINDLSSWARAEIGLWLEEQGKEGDMAAIGYGLSRYWDISVKRAQCWIKCQKEFPQLFSLANSDSPAQTNDEETSGIDDSGPKQTKLPKRQLLPHLGRSSLVLQSEDAILRIIWKLQFDWTGDVESTVSVEAALPQSWHEADSGDALRKIPATFDALMRERGVTQAVRVITGLLFDTQA